MKNKDKDCFFIYENGNAFGMEHTRICLLKREKDNLIYSEKNMPSEGQDVYETYTLSAEKIDALYDIASDERLFEVGELSIAPVLDGTKETITLRIDGREKKISGSNLWYFDPDEDNPQLEGPFAPNEDTLYIVDILKRVFEIIDIAMQKSK